MDESRENETKIERKEQEEDRKEAKEEEKRELALRIFRQSRGEIVLSLRFFDLALSSFHYQESKETLAAGTDGTTIFYNFETLRQMYCLDPALVNRLTLHMTLHCIYRHLYRRKNREEVLWNLACDIAVEYLIDGLDCPPLRQKEGQSGGSIGLRRDFYAKMTAQIPVMTAEGIYRIFKKQELSERSLSLLSEEFLVDDHQFWGQKSRDRQSNDEQKWNDISDKTQSSMEARSKEQGIGQGNLAESLTVSNRQKTDFRSFLRKFAVLHEEIQVDEDSYDPIFYTFGLSMYGNLPLVEPQEFKEVQKIEEFVLAIDTSHSTSGEPVRAFLSETFHILKESESFFHNVHIRILQCDSAVVSDVEVRNEEELDRYMENFTLKGGGGTDFRPVFRYVEKLQEEGSLQELKGLLYFTDGRGIFPEKRPPYETAFVFLNDIPPDVKLPPWAIGVVAEEEELEEDVKRDRLGLKEREQMP